MAFRFDFDISSENESLPAVETSANSLKGENDQTCPDKKSPLVILKDVSRILQSRSKCKLEYDSLDLLNEESSGGTKTVAPLLRVRESASLAEDEDVESGTFLQRNDLVEELERRQTDLVPGVYEGGMKVWECSVDLCQFLVKQWGTDGKQDVPQGGSVLELGCGHGLPGCLVLRQEFLRRRSKETHQGAPFCVIFTDYNEFVLQNVTISNIVLNTRDLCNSSHLTMDMVAKHVILAGGDWMDLSHDLQCGNSPQQQTAISQQEAPRDGRFDLILAAETTYTTKSAKDTATLMARHLALDTGVGLVATKRYYFGVGGGSDEFRKAAASERVCVSSGEELLDYRLHVQTLQVYDNGAGNIRELLRVSCVRK